MTDDLLTSLCSICHVRPYKYRCPRCSTLTCSLPCIKRHKAWAQCDGVRNPAAYMKQSELTTAKGIDHDYNYLVSIERELDGAEREAGRRGFVLEEKNEGQNKAKVKGQASLEAALDRCGVVIVKAPKGMSRGKMNTTRVTKKDRHIVWTVEWVHLEGRKEIGSCSETQPLAEAYADVLKHLDPKDRSNKRRKVSRDEPEADPQTGRALRGRGQDHSKPLLQTSRINETTSEKSGGDAPSKNTNCNSNPSTHETHHQLSEPKSMTGTQDSKDNILDTRDSVPPARLDGKSSHSDFPQDMHPPTSLATSSQPVSPSQLTYHLHHPSLPSKKPVLIPLTPESTLSTSLTNRLVLEFPTIYVLFQQPDGKLPDDFVSEADFFERGEKERLAGGVMDFGSLVHGRGGTNARTGELEEGEVDEKSLVEVLGKDLKGIGGSL